ncbi:MAG: hypothetical protein M1457_06605 [bacterium]|nr:hypothetical protein [bacterium]
MEEGHGFALAGARPQETVVEVGIQDRGRTDVTLHMILVDAETVQVHENPVDQDHPVADRLR